jgi:hypothetical protein
MIKLEVQAGVAEASLWVKRRRAKYYCAGLDKAASSFLLAVLYFYCESLV